MSKLVKKNQIQVQYDLKIYTVIHNSVNQSNKLSSEVVTLVEITLYCSIQYNLVNT